MLISGRDVALRLAADCGLHRLQVRALLAAGLAGEPVRAGSAHLYDDAVIADLARRQIMTYREVEDACPRGPFIARVSPAREFHAAAAWEEQAAALEEWHVSAVTCLWMSIDRPVRFPFVATLADFVVWGAEITGWHPGSPVPGSPRRRRMRFQFAPPGDWFTGFEKRRIPLGPGQPYVIPGAPGTMLRDRPAAASPTEPQA